MRKIDLRIEKLVAGGVGLGREADGRVCLVPFALPDEEVRIAVRRDRGDYLEGELLEIIRPHPERVEPPCPHFGFCGGCDLQHASYRLQVELKQAILLELLDRAGLGGGKLSPILEEPLAAPSPFGYRQRLRMQVDGAGRWGFYRRRSHELAVVEDCPIARPEMAAVLRSFPGATSLNLLLRHCDEVEIALSQSDATLVLSLLMSRKPRPADLKGVQRIFGELPGLKAITLAAAGWARQVILPETIGGGTNQDVDRLYWDFPARPHFGLAAYRLGHEPGGFSQVNPEQNQGMLDTMLAWLNDREIARVADLYCGMGNFSIPLALTGKRVFGADLQRSAIRSAERNASDAGLANCLFVQSSAEEAAERLIRQGEGVDLLILDPPRRGCPEVMPFLLRLMARLILYISCDPATLARDLRSLEAAGYRMVKLRLVDMFPQTAHMETMVLLQG